MRCCKPKNFRKNKLKQDKLPTNNDKMLALYPGRCYNAYISMYKELVFLGSGQ